MSEGEYLFSGMAFGACVVLLMWLLSSGMSNRNALNYAQTHYCVPIADKITEEAR